MDGQPVQIYKFINDRQRELDVPEIDGIFRKAKGLPIAIISVNGNKRTGKSFILNYFLKYLRCPSKELENWIDWTEGLNGFAYRGGVERQTVGMWMWSEPLFTNNANGDKIAVILMDTQGSFDAQTSFQEIAVMFAVSVWLSSVFIYNITGDVSEDKLQFLEYFADFSTNFIAEEQVTYDKPLFQNLLLLVRDWPNVTDFSYGHHNSETPQENNFMRQQILSAEMNDFTHGASETRLQILRQFDSTSCFLLPHPGLKIDKGDTPTKTNLEEEFKTHLAQFVPLVFEMAEPKKMYGDITTDKELLELLNRWKRIFQTVDIPQATTMADAIAESQLVMALRRVEKTYHTNMQEICKKGLSDLEFTKQSETIKKEQLAALKKTTQKFPKFEEEYIANLNMSIENVESFFTQQNRESRHMKEQTVNLARVEREGKRIQSELEEQKRQMEEQKENFQILTNSNEQHKLEHEQKMQKMEENYKRKLLEESKIREEMCTRINEIRKQQSAETAKCQSQLEEHKRQMEAQSENVTNLKYTNEQQKFQHEQKMQRMDEEFRRKLEEELNRQEELAKKRINEIAERQSVEKAKIQSQLEEQIRQMEAQKRNLNIVQNANERKRLEHEQKMQRMEEDFRNKLKEESNTQKELAKAMEEIRKLRSVEKVIHAPTRPAIRVGCETMAFCLKRVIVRNRIHAALNNVSVLYSQSNKRTNIFSYSFDWSYVDVETGQNVTSSTNVHVGHVPVGEETSVCEDIPFSETRGYWQVYFECCGKHHKINKNNAQVNPYSQDNGKYVEITIRYEGDYIRLDFVMESGNAYFYANDGLE